MKPISKIEGICVPLAVRDVDTDMIIPAQYLTSIGKNGFGVHLFKRLREQNNNFPLNLLQYKEASILLSGPNFGCGSSREHAVWSLQQGGIRVVIASSFADIFKNNSGKNGFLTIELPEDIVQNLQHRAQDKLTLCVDLVASQVTVPAQKQEPEVSYPFTYDAFRRHCLLNGLDDLDYLLSHKKEIDTYFQKQASQ
jgi:3-isopropylmalate/(R)-2-methylmalate dehydratase small subunit